MLYDIRQLTRTELEDPRDSSPGQLTGHAISVLPLVLAAKRLFDLLLLHIRLIEPLLFQWPFVGTAAALHAVDTHGKGIGRFRARDRQRIAAVGAD